MRTEQEIRDYMKDIEESKKISENILKDAKNYSSDIVAMSAEHVINQIHTINLLKWILGEKEH